MADFYIDTYSIETPMMGMKNAAADAESAEASQTLSGSALGTLVAGSVTGVAGAGATARDYLRASLGEAIRSIVDELSATVAAYGATEDANTGASDALAGTITDSWSVE